MCDSCRKILGRCVKIHDSKLCPLKKASYCTFCSNYGHSSKECSFDVSCRNYTIEENIEIALPCKRYIDYFDDPKEIRALLKSLGKLPRKEERNKDKYKKQLFKVAKEMNAILVEHKLEHE